MDRFVAILVFLAILVAIGLGAPGAKRALFAFLVRRAGPGPERDPARDDAPQAPSPATWGVNVRPASPELEQDIEKNLRGGG